MLVEKGELLGLRRRLEDNLAPVADSVLLTEPRH
jgi:hypothetical protein